MSTKKTLPTKLKPVLKNNSKNEKIQFVGNLKIDEFVKKLAHEVSNEVVNKTVRKAVASTEFTKDLLSVSVRKAVQSSELLQKYPPLPANLRKLAEPTTATYIALYNKHRNVLRPKTVGSVKMKIAKYLEKIDEISLQDELDKAARMNSRKKRKTEARQIQKRKDFVKFCDEKCDDIFSLILSKFTEAFNPDREIPQPLILGSSSSILYKSIQEQMTKLISPKKPAENATASADTTEPTAKKPISGAPEPTAEPTAKKPISGDPKPTAEPTAKKPISGAPEPTAEPTAKKPISGDPKPTTEPTAKKSISGAPEPTAEPTTKKPISGAPKPTADPTTKKPTGGAPKPTADTAVDTLVNKSGDVENAKEDPELKEIVDRLSYFIMEFVQNSLVEAV